jgi:ArsR family transcriptional regulator, arsenate/arsenite/antimonite-responsive transcriptional repressor
MMGVMATSRCTPVAHVDERDLSAEATLFKALGDPHRLTIIATLVASSHPVCVCDLTEGLPIGQSSVSHHLAILREAGVVTSERRGTWAYYSLVPRLRARLGAAVDTVAPKRGKLEKAS